MFCDIAIDLGPPDTKQRSDEFEYPITRERAHRTESAPARPAKEVQQESFDLIVGLMREKNRPTPPPFAHRFKKRQPLLTRGGFDRLLSVRRKRRNVSR